MASKFQKTRALLLTTPARFAFLFCSGIPPRTLKPLVALTERSPLAAQVAAFLLRGQEGNLIDLGDTLVLIPTAGAGRAIRRELSKKGVLSPQFRLPMDVLLLRNFPVASRLEREVAWSMMLNPDDRQRFASLVPKIVPLHLPDDRFGVSEHLCRVCDQLAEAGLDPSSPNLATKLEEDARRWEAFGTLYAEYLALLSKHGLRDPNDARIEQATNPSVPSELKRVIVACIPDLAPILETYLQSLENKGIDVAVLAWSPADEGKHLDAMGRPDPTWWRSHMPELTDEMIVVENDPASEAGVLIDCAAASTSDGYALFSAAPESTVAMGAEIAAIAPGSRPQCLTNRTGQPSCTRRLVTAVDNVARKRHFWAMAVKEAVVRARVDEKLKHDSEAILHRLGISQTEAIRMFFSQVVLRKGLPFAVSLQSEDNDDLLLPRAKRQAAIDAIYES